jgi:hypothetical protein
MEEIGACNARDNSALFAGRSKPLDEAPMPALCPVFTVPILPKLVSFSRLHCGYEFESVERLPAGVDLLEDNADCFF